MLRIISWNILYRSYEEKYKPESYILKTPEPQRIQQIVDMIINYQKDNITTIYCFQEVSSECIEKLYINFDNNKYNFFEYNIYLSENLLIIAPKNFYLINKWKNTLSNGYISISDGYICIINTHMKPQQFTKLNVMNYINKLQHDYMITFIAGDFNENYKIINKKLSTNYHTPYYGKTYNNKSIDHIIFSKYLDKNWNTFNIKSNNLSDHNMIILQIN